MGNKNHRRLLLLLKLLYERTDEKHFVSSPDILRCWADNGVPADRKTVYSCVQTLVDFGVDVVCDRSAQNRYFIGNRLFELPELKLLVSAVESSHLISEEKSAVLIQKLGRLTSSFLAEQLSHPSYIDAAQKPRNDRAYYSVDTIQTAICSGRPVSFRYYEYTRDRERVLKHGGYRYILSPYTLIWNRDFYYVVGWSEKHGGLAQFRVDRMTDVAPADGAYRERGAFDPEAYLREVFGMYFGETRHISLLCENRTMRSIVDRFGESADTEPVGMDHFRVKADVVPSPPFFAWVFTFGGAIRIEGPDEVLETMRDMAEWLRR